MRGDVGFPVRLRFAKRGKVRWIGHRDVARAFERAFRIERLPLAFTEGFSPRPKVSFGLALSVGFESDAEYLDVQLGEPVDPESLVAALSAALPEGLEVTGAVALRDRAPALQEAVSTVSWHVAVAAGSRDAPTDPAALEATIERALALPALETTRRRKGREVTEDVRPPIERIEVGDPEPDGTVGLLVECSTRPRSPKPTEILAAIGEGLGLTQAPEAVRVLRTHQWIERDGARLQPLDADPRPHVPEARAS